MITKTRIIPDEKHALKKLPLLHHLQAQYLYYPITNQRCPEGETCVVFGQFVKVGEVIGTRKAAFFEQPIHATVSGEVVGHEMKYDATGKKVDCLIVKNDFKYELHESVKTRTDEEIEKLTKEDYIKIAKDAGLVGLGGSGFPTYIKLNTKSKIDIVLANGVECEPKLISDYELMMNHPEELIKGLIYAMNAVGAKQGVIAVKKKYVELVERLNFALAAFHDYDIKVTPVGNYYPQGWELEAIKSATGIVVPQGKLPGDYGVIPFNVSTLQSLYHAVKFGLPVLERYFVISGDGAVNKSFKARIGTSIQSLLDIAGGYIEPSIPKTLILGGPMMGSSLLSDDIVLQHTTTSLIVQNTPFLDEDPCIHCASCVYSCPVSLQPVQIMNAVKAEDKDFLKALTVNKCIECGLCSFVCPSKIHLTDYMRQGKRMIR
ncbi:RnfABCDGE type electron transport complex subunit C [Acholeplasma hippikon]|uniref:Ion-translocating oxidoreductase complex subunit C n=1 Tax=Acholeplasma hippikon TaxID=264636 RepID=A0A449BKK6_9MOLU|nr:RnfABCDGE type electron transport complex subunit C [Acholeplasma hippikon]VEU83001.1 Nitrogen fixation protein rnfC [Acholeplasma hippikon]